jgi:plastocyanin
MNMRRHITPLATFSLITLAALVASCGDKATNPGGGGGGLELNSGNIANGATYVHTFATAGTYNYRCTIHGGMTGSVVVGGAGAPPSAGVTITDNAFNPTPAAVAAGGTVTWTNNGSTHTVTSN